MKTLTVDEAAAGLGKWLELALAGEAIQIRKDDSIFELRPARAPRPLPVQESLAPREALRQLQQDVRLTSVEAEGYLRAVSAERLEAEDRHPGLKWRRRCVT